MRSTRDFVTGILTGVAIGILTAPRAGKETRDQLMSKVNSGTGGDGSGNWQDKLNNVVEQVKSQVNQWMGQPKNQNDQFRTDYDYERSTAKSQYNNAVDDVADRTRTGVNDVSAAIKVD